MAGQERLPDSSHGNDQSVEFLTYRFIGRGQFRLRLWSRPSRPSQIQDRAGSCSLNDFVKESDVFCHSFRILDRQRALFLQDNRIEFARCDSRGRATRIPMRPQRGSSDAHQFVRNVDALPSGHRGDHTGQVISLSKAVANEENSRSESIGHGWLHSSTHKSNEGNQGYDHVEAEQQIADCSQARVRRLVDGFPEQHGERGNA